jgi:Protein of unknown function (DUF742)
VSDARPDGAGHDFVRPFIMTGGRTARNHLDLRFETLVRRLSEAQVDATMATEKVRILGLAAGPISVAELAAELALVVGVVNVLIEDLVDSGHLEVFLDDVVDDGDDDDLDVLTRISDKIRSL